MARFVRENGVYVGTHYFNITKRYYIHHHQKNIGRANGQNTDSNSITNILQSQKQQALASSKYNYKQLLQSQLDGDSMILLNTLYNEDKFISTLDKGLKESIQQGLDKNLKQVKLMELYRGQLAKNSFSKAFDNAATRVADFNKLLESLAEASQLIESQDGANLALALLAQRKSSEGGASISSLGQRLEQALNSFTRNNDGSAFQQEQLSRAVQYMNYLAQGLKTGAFATSKDKDKGLTEKNVSTSIGHIFNLGFAEGIVNISDKMAISALDNTFKTIFTGEGQIFKGANPVASITYEPGDINKEFGKGNKEYGKADNSLGKVKTSFEYEINGETANVDVGLTIDTSVKFLQGQGFRNLDSKRKLKTFSTGSLGIKLGEAISSIYGVGSYNTYLAYNVISRNLTKSWKKQNRALQDIILTRYLINAVSSRGGKGDFAQFILANGEVISVWELILLSEKFLGYSTSENQDQPISLHIDGREEIDSSYRKKDMQTRVVRTNDAINNTGLKASIHFDKLTKALQH